MTPGKAGAHRDLVGEFLSCMEQGDLPPSLPAVRVDEWLLRIEREGGVTGESLRYIAKNLKMYVAIARFLDNRRDRCPKNATLTVPGEGNALLVKLANLAAEIESCFEPDGTVSDRASSELSRLRARVVTIRRRLTERMERIAEREQDLLQDRAVGVKNDRFVLMVRADAHRRLTGIVHGSSSTGATIFIEPEEIIEAGNDLTLAAEEIAREEARIIASLAQAVHGELDHVTDACRVIIDVETRIAAARLSIDIGAHVPQNAASGEVELMRGRHPLLVLSGVNVVPCDVRLTAGGCTVISGPNAGGKTVVLKTIGLLGLMSAAGLPIPAAPDTRFGIPTAVLTDIGDDQSLKENLSTFSAHMTNITRILSQAKTGALVLLDELAAGTDPAEGAALAEALLEKLADKGASTLATTHFDALKTRAMDGGPFRNASVGFDVATMKPTFEFTEGMPGSSSALAVAERFGAPRDVVARARALMPSASRRLEAAIASVEDERRRIAEERRSLTDVRRQVEELEQKKMEELKKLKAREKKFIDEEAEALWTEIRKAREEVREAEKHLKRERRDAQVVSRAKKAADDAAEKLSSKGVLNREHPDGLPGKAAAEEHLTPGANVYVIPFKKEGKIASGVRGKEVFVTIGGLKTKVQLEDLRIVDEKKEKAKKPSGAPTFTPVFRREDPISTNENTVDLRGLTADEALDATDAFLDKAQQSDLSCAFIIHGHGTGVLRDRIRTYVATSPYVADARPGEQGEGGDGVTVVWLR
jgi:DNA mismatch repair protein MutS2